MYPRHGFYPLGAGTGKHAPFVLFIFERFYHSLAFPVYAFLAGRVIL